MPVFGAPTSHFRRHLQQLALHQHPPLMVLSKMMQSSRALSARSLSSMLSWIYSGMLGGWLIFNIWDSTVGLSQVWSVTSLSNPSSVSLCHIFFMSSFFPIICPTIKASDLHWCLVAECLAFNIDVVLDFSFIFSCPPTEESLSGSH